MLNFTAMEKHVAFREEMFNYNTTAEENTWQWLLKFMDEASHMIGKLHALILL